MICLLMLPSARMPARASSRLAPALLLLGMLLFTCVWVPALAQQQQQQQQQQATIDDGLVGSSPAAAAPPTDLFSTESPAPKATSTNGSSYGPLSPGGKNATGSPAGEAPRRLKLQGVATVAYGADPITAYGAVTLGCSLGYVSPTFQSNYIGVSADLFANSATCGRCVKLQCDDQSCAEPGRELPALIVDLCGSCSGSDVAISTPMFQNLTGCDPGSSPSITVTWEPVDCEPLTQGNIKMLVKPGGSPYYQAISFSNAAQPITAVQINGTTLKRGSSNAWDYNPGAPINPQAPLKVALLGANRQVLQAVVPKLRSADLGVQFK